MKRVVCFGEAVIDFLNTGQLREGEMSLNSFTQFPGGAPANAAVAVAKLGGEAVFAGQVGDDPFGHFLLRCSSTVWTPLLQRCTRPQEPHSRSCFSMTNMCPARLVWSDRKPGRSRPLPKRYNKYIVRNNVCYNYGDKSWKLSCEKSVIPSL